MDRLEVAIAIKTILDDVEGICKLPQYNSIHNNLDRRIIMLLGYYQKQYWWLKGNRFEFTIIRDHTNKCYDAEPNNYLRAFIDFVFEGKREHAVPSYLREFPLIEPIQPVYVQNINEPVYG